MDMMPHSLQTQYRSFGPSNENILRIHTKQILSALAYLHKHESRIVHGDLKAANILFDGKQVKLTDFGDSRILGHKNLEFERSQSESGVKFMDIKGSILWMAPEVIMNKPVGTRSDIWSLGQTMIELSTADNPWPDIKNVGDLLQRILNKEQPKIPEHLSP
jgi:serine/threonine protein kinase